MEDRYDYESSPMHHDTNRFFNINFALKTLQLSTVQNSELDIIPVSRKILEVCIFNPKSSHSSQELFSTHTILETFSKKKNLERLWLNFCMFLIHFFLTIWKNKNFPFFSFYQLPIIWALIIQKKHGDRAV